MADRVCSECGASLQGRSATVLTCSNKCRSARHRRLEREAKQSESYDEQARQEVDNMKQAANAFANDKGMIARTARGVMEPIIREAITEDTIQAIGHMVNLMPQAIELIQSDMQSEDPLVRQRAYTLLMKYTAGNRAVVPDQPVDKGAVLNVNFGLPRPDDADIPINEAVEMKVCDMCSQEKPDSEFVANSNRCQLCFEDWREKITEGFGK